MMRFFQPEQYQDKCKQLFYKYHALLTKQLPKAQIEHIGASAIPNCVSKGDLDIYVAVNFDQHKKAISMIKDIGFKVKEDTLRTQNLCMLESLKDKDVAIQLVVKGSEFESFLQFKQALIQNPELVQKYNQLKQSCINLSPDEYREIKSKFIEELLT